MNTLNHDHSSSSSSRSSSSIHEIQFQSKIDKLCSYSDYDLIHLQKDSHVNLFKGARAAATEPLVLRAFSVLYEDMSVLRLGGNMMFNYLTARGEESKKRVDAEREQLSKQLNKDITEEEFVEKLSVFNAIDVNKDSVLSREELAEALSNTLKVFNTDVDTFLKNYQPQSQPTSSSPENHCAEVECSIEFDEFIVALLEAIEATKGTVTLNELGEEVRERSQ